MSQQDVNKTDKAHSAEVEAADKANEQLPSVKANDDYPGWLTVFRGWLRRTGEHEVKDLMDFFDRSKVWWETAAELTADEFAQKSTYLKRDLMMFYRHYQKDMDDSEFVQSIRESVWQELAEMTDKAQIEWQELKKDFDHDGIYHAGEWVGMGTLVCKSCHYKMDFVHPEELSKCPQCGGSSFIREALAP